MYVLPAVEETREGFRCAIDCCGTLAEKAVACGNGVCESYFGENDNTCPQDCKKRCGAFRDQNVMPDGSDFGRSVCGLKEDDCSGPHTYNGVTRQVTCKATCYEDLM